MRKLLLSIGLLCLACTAFAQSLLWRVSGRDLKVSSYLYGTIHIQDKRVFAFDSTVWHCFNSCDALAVEVLLDRLDYSTVREKMLLPEGQSLVKMLSKEDLAVLDSLCKAKLGVGVIFLGNMKPFFLSSALQQADLPKEMPLALDLFFLQQARNRGMYCYGLEDYMDQIKATDAITLDDQLKILRQTLHETGDVAASFDSLTLAYLAFDLETITKMLDDTMLPDNFRRVLVEKRNQTMYKGFRKLAKKQRVFCAVGAAHLPGDKGLIGLLRKKGYTVEPVNFEWNVDR
ncbi:MAG: TraB/GumN family protein [Bacteroidales bacterium]|nr:TraB/GumN family protein [Bacteroidales bacterium]